MNLTPALISKFKKKNKLSVSKKMSCNSMNERMSTKQSRSTFRQIHFVHPSLSLWEV